MTLIGVRSSTATKATSPISTALRIPQITPTATNPQLGRDLHCSLWICTVRTLSVRRWAPCLSQTLQSASFWIGSCIMLSRLQQHSIQGFALKTSRRALEDKGTRSVSFDIVCCHHHCVFLETNQISIVCHQMGAMFTKRQFIPKHNRTCRNHNKLPVPDANDGSRHHPEQGLGRAR